MKVFNNLRSTVVNKFDGISLKDFGKNSPSTDKDTGELSTAIDKMSHKDYGSTNKMSLFSTDKSVAKTYMKAGGLSKTQQYILKALTPISLLLSVAFLAVNIALPFITGSTNIANKLVFVTAAVIVSSLIVIIMNKVGVIADMMETSNFKKSNEQYSA